LTQPRLLLLDEPLASLDAARREEILPYLETLRDQLAIPMVYVTHHYDEVLRLATCLVLMEDGRSVAQGGLGEMSLNPALRMIVGPDAVGAIVDGTVLGVDPASGLTRVKVGRTQGASREGRHRPQVASAVARAGSDRGDGSAAEFERAQCADRRGHGGDERR
jgi:molybdate transport system ATP-binding protein